MGLWRPRGPTVCCLQAGDPGNPVAQVSPSPKSEEPGSCWCLVSESHGPRTRSSKIRGLGKEGTPAQEERGNALSLQHLAPFEQWGG